MLDAYHRPKCRYFIKFAATHTHTSAGCALPRSFEISLNWTIKIHGRCICWAVDKYIFNALLLADRQNCSKTKNNASSLIVHWLKCTIPNGTHTHTHILEQSNLEFLKGIYRYDLMQKCVLACDLSLPANIDYSVSIGPSVWVCVFSNSKELDLSDFFIVYFALL